MRKHLGTLTIGLGLGLGLVAAPAAVAAPEGLLYVQQAAGGSLRKVDGRWRLTLQRPARRVTTFADRPARRGGSLSLRRFVSGWRAAFGNDAPNAALEVSGAPAARDVVLLELGRPRLNGRGDRITYAARPLRTSSNAALAALERRADRARGGTFGRASLFIDDGGPANLLVVTFSGVPTPQGFQINLTAPLGFDFTPPGSLIVNSAGVVWRLVAQQFTVGCDITPCQGSATIAVNAPVDQPLSGNSVLPATGTVTGSWAGGPVQTFPGAADGGGPFTLQPGS